MIINWNSQFLLQLILFISIAAEFATGEKVPLPLANFGTWVTWLNGSTTPSWSVHPKYLAACSEPTSLTDSYVTSLLIHTGSAQELTLDVGYELRCCQNGKNFAWGIEVYSILNTHQITDSHLNPMVKTYDYIGSLVNTTAMQGTTLYPFKSSLNVGLKGGNGIFIGFRNQGICGNIKSLNITYMLCPSLAGEMMTFPPTVAPNSTVASQRVDGNCVDNAKKMTSSSENYMICYANGTARSYGGCHCKAGYQNSTSTTCSDCPSKTFKTSAGNYPCTKCGANVKDGLKPRTTLCECEDGYYRPSTKLNIANVNCEAPPSAPRNFSATDINSRWAWLKWNGPNSQGTGDSPQYKIESRCSGCSVFEDTTSQLFYNLTALKTFTEYTVKVFSVNNVTAAVGFDKASSVETSFLTGSGLPSRVRNITLERNDDGSVTVNWRAPAEKGGADLRYFVVLNGDKGRYTKELKYTIEQKQDKKTYTVSVKSHTSAGFSKEATITFDVQGKGEGVPIVTVISVGASFFVVLLIAIILVIHFYRKRHPKHLQPVRLENGEVILPSKGGATVYIDPTTYQDLEDAVQQFANELDRSWIELERLIGGGEFGDVYRGTLIRPSHKAIVVAIKTLKSNTNKKARDDFLAEAAYMGQFDDPNVITLEGVVVKDRPILIVTEFMSNGSLDSYLQENDGKFTPLQLLGMARGVSSGMTYLSEMSYIHRDLAARNILVNEEMVCKVADFGMSRELSEEETYNTTGGKIPVRWTAPEAIQFKKFTIASDVWSYGVLLWEIMSYGERPYWDWGNYEVLERLASGYRLPPPMNCPKVVHDLMLSCWRKDRVKRPKFRDLRNTIDKWIRSPELLKHEASVVTKRDTNLDYASMKTLTEWLESIGMSRYIENFTERGLVTPRQILDLTEADLKEIGIVAVGHRNKIVKSINATKGQLVRTKSLAV